MSTPSFRVSVVSFPGSARESILAGLFVCLSLLAFIQSANAQSSNAMGVPAESKRGQSTASTYARDKIETVNLANGNFSLAIPLATVGGRGDASFTIALAYNSKVWSSQRDREPVVVEGGEQGTPINHYSAMYEKDIDEYEPGLAKLGGGWSIRIAPAIKGRLIGIDHMPTTCNHETDGIKDCGFKYALSKMWLTLPDGSQVEMRDVLTQGAPSLITDIRDGYHALTDRDRGRVWRSVDGSNIIFIRDADSGLNFISNETFTASGWVFLPSGARMRIDFYGIAEKLIDRNGNFINFGPTYTDELGRQTTVETVNGVVTVTVKGYLGTPDRSITINTGQIGTLLNLRQDVRSLPRPFTTGDAYHDQQSNYFPHTIQEPHTDLFIESEGVIAYSSLAGDDVGNRTAVTQLNLLDGRFFRFRYNQYGELAEIDYPGGGVSEIDYVGAATSSCEVSAPIAFTLNRRVSQRRVLKNGVDVDATWRYGASALTIDGVERPGVTVEVREGAAETGTLLSSENHFFRMLNADYRSCGGPLTGTGNEKWENAKELYTAVETGSGTIVTKRDWGQRAALVWGNDVNLGYNDYYVNHGQDQAQNDERVNSEETILENGKAKLVEYGYDQFNNITSIKEYDFGTAGAPGDLLRQTVRTYVTALNGICYSNLDPTDSSCGSALASDVTSIVYQPGLLLSESIHDGSGVPNTSNQKARTDLEYDNYASDTNQNHAPIQQNAQMIHYDGSRFAGFQTTVEPRGNVTSTTRWFSGGADIVAFSKYDNAGQVIWSKDPRGNISTVTYTDNFGNGSNPDSATAAPNGATFALASLAVNALNHQVKMQYDYALGALTGTKDANGVINRTEYDSLGRPSQVTSALNLAEQAISKMSYPDAQNNSAKVSTQLDATRWITTKTDFDQFDRPITSWQAEDGQDINNAVFTIRVNTKYDGLDRVKQVSNPYRPATETDVYTNTSYDLAGRVISLKTPDNAEVATAYDGNRVLVIDQAGKKRVSATDGLGRLCEIWEVIGSGTDTVSFLNYQNLAAYHTTYSYDTLNSLTMVNQGSQTRSFVYDSLKRLVSATNPESGAICYGTIASGQCQTDGYDANGNLLKKTDARGVVSTYSYDVLNRNTGVSYTNDAANTPAITRSYDNSASGARGIGRLWKTETSGAAGSRTTIDNYDAMGRPLTQRQQFYFLDEWSADYTVSATYDLAGHVKTLTYPSNRAVTYNYDGAGRLGDKDAQNLAFTGNLGDNTTRTYAAGITYSPFGGMSREQFGTDTPIWQKRHYNIRGQLYDVRASTVNDDGNWNRGAIVNYYSLANYGFGTSGTDNNGNLQIQQMWVPADDAISGTSFMQQNYAYDDLNRISWVGEYVNGDAQNLSGSQSFTYDRWGNRTISGANGAGINGKQFTVNSANNRLGVPSGQTGTMSYDAAGNLTNDTYSGNGPRVYDAENRMIQAGSNYFHWSLYSTYTYDGDGRRVRRYAHVMGADFQFLDEEKWQVYGLGGELLAEYEVAAAADSPQSEYGYRNGELLVTFTPVPGGGEVSIGGGEGGEEGPPLTPPVAVHWLVTDQLGTPRIILDQSGSLANVGRHDYLPFGEELYAGTGNRTGALGYGSTDNVRQKFTQKERDGETGLDYFNARYYLSVQGRFTSPDEFKGGPEELFEDVEPHDPLFYADVAEPQSLNKYSYSLNNPLRFIDPDGHQTKPADNIKLPTDNLASRILGFADQARRVTNNILIGPAGSKVSDAAADLLDQGIHAFNKAMYGPLGDKVNAIQDNPTVRVVGLIVGAAGELKQTRSNIALAVRDAEVADTTPATTPYSRPSNATTTAQRASVQGKPCVDCGKVAPRMNAGHKVALVKEYYQTGTINRTRMRSLGATHPHCPTCSSREGAIMSRYSRRMRERIQR